MATSYDDIGNGYALTRQPDPRIESAIITALGKASSIANIGAGAGSYEPGDRDVIAIEPSMTMIKQRNNTRARVIQGSAEKLPLKTDSVDVALAVLTVHHWQDLSLGLREMKRVAKDRVVIFTWDQEVWESFWLIREYHPMIREIDRPRAHNFSAITEAFNSAEITPVPIPHDCIDGFHGAFWRRPHAYLDPQTRAGISTYANMPEDELNRGLHKLATDLDDGTWHHDHKDLLDKEELDLGYRLIVASSE